MKSLEERVTALETNWFTLANAICAMIQNTMCNEVPKPTPRLPFEHEEMASPQLLSPAVHFGLDARQRAHWADVYSRMVMAGKLHTNEVSSMNFTYLLCGAGTAPLGPIRWCGTTRELAYMVRRHLGSRWEVALAVFNDKNNRPLPQSIKNTKPPCDKSAQKIDYFFRKKD